MKKRLLSAFMALALCLTLLPAPAWAAEPDVSETPDAAVAAVQAQIDALPDAETLPNMDGDAAMAAYDAVQAAYDAYEALSEEQQAQVTGADRFEGLFGWFNSQVAVLEDSGNIYPDVVDADGGITAGTIFNRNGPIVENSNDSTTFYGNQYYVVKESSNVTINGDLIIDSCTNNGLILCKGATLTVTGALIHKGGTFPVYGVSDNGENAGRLVIENSLDSKGAAIRPAADATGTPTLHIYSGELEIHSGNSQKLVDGVKLYSKNKVHTAALDNKQVLLAAWSDVSSIKRTTLVLTYCEHSVNDQQQYIADANGTDGSHMHHRYCTACGFTWSSETYGLVPLAYDEETHTMGCDVCENYKLKPEGHSYKNASNPVPTDDGKGHTGKVCSVCGAAGGESSPHTYGADGRCKDCKFKPAFEDSKGNLYEYNGSDSIDALNEAIKKGETSFKLVNFAQGEGADAATVGAAFALETDANVTLDMNGKTLKASGGTPVLAVSSGALTVTGDAAIIQGGASQETYKPAIEVTGGSLVFEGDLTAQGGKYGNYCRQPAVKATGGTLRLKAGDVLNGGVSVAGSTTYANVNALLGENLAFAKVGETSAIVKGDVESISENVTVVAHTHDFTLGSDGKYTCACGFSCPHNDFKDGKCTICGNGCAHTNVDENGLCPNCKTQMAVKSETGGTVTYGTDFAAAMRSATNGTKITLLADVSILGRTGISGDNTTVTLDLNEHKITGGWLDVGNRDATTYTTRTLKIIGKGSYEPPEFGGLITVFVKATLDLSEWEGGTISEISISDNSTYDAETREPAVIVGPKAGTIGKLSFGNNQLGELKKTKLSGGSFNEIWVAGFGPVKLGELLADGYAYQNADGSYVKYETTLQDASIYNVKVVKCLHPNMKPDETGVATCEYCGKSGKFVASVDGNLYTDMDEAISYWLANGGTLKLYADYTAADGTWSIGSGSHTINLNGHMMSVKGDGAFFKPTNNMHLTVTDGTERGQITNILLDGSQGGSFTLENGFVGNLVMTGGAVVALKGGSVDELDVKNCSVNTNLSIQGGSLGKLNIEDWADGMHVSATGGSLGGYTLPSGKILADVLDHQYYATGTSLDKRVDAAAQKWEKFDIKQAPHDFGSTSKAAAVPINGSIPFTVDSPSENVGVYDVKWYRRTNSGAEHMTENKVAGVNVNDTLDVFCVITGLDRPGGAMQWQVAVKGYTIKVVPAKLNDDRTVIRQKPDTGNTQNPADNRLVVTPFSSSTLNDVEYKFEVTYNGQPLKLGEDYTIKGSSNLARNAGTYTLTIEGRGNYTGTAAHQWEIKPYTLSKDLAVTSIVRDYDGTTNLSAEELIGLGRFIENLENRNSKNPSLGADQSSLTIRLGAEDFEVSNVKLGSAEAGDTTASFTIKLKPRPGQTAANFVFEDGTSEMTVKEVPVSTRKAFLSSSPKAGELNVANDHAGVYTLDLSKLLPKLESPMEYGAVTYGAPTVNLSSDYYTSGAKVEDGKLILPIQAVKTSKESNIGTVTVKVTSGNIVDFDLTINVIAKNRITPTGTPTLSKNAITYGDALNTIALSGKLYDNVNNVDVDGTFEWVDGTHIPVVGNGTYAAEWIFEPTNTEKYLTVSGRSNITVEKAQQYGKVSMDDYVYGKTPSTPSLTDRTGDGSVTCYYTTTNSNSGGTKWENIQADTLNAGTYYMYAELGETENYGSFTAACVQFRVVKAMPTYTAPTGLTAKYGQTLADVKLSNPEGNLDGTWSWMNSSESVGDASTVTKTFQAKFTPKDTENYNTVENIELEVMVNKADGRNLKTVELEQKYTDTSEHTYTPDWAGLPAGQDWTFSSEATIVLPKQDFAADGSLLTYAISGGKAGDKITITLKASCDNYEDFTITLNVTLTEKDDQKSLTITGGTTVVYGQTLQLGTSGGSGSGAVTYTVTNGTGEATIDSNGVLMPVRIGSVTVTATKAGDSEYNAVTSSPVEITITRATPTGEPAYTKITASGKTLADAALGIGTITPAGGTIAWDDPTTTEVVANKSYGWTYTPTDTNYTTRTGTIKLWSKSSGGGSGRTAAVVAPDMPMLYRGCTGDAVKTLQDKLNTLGYNSGNVDGIFGAKTYAAVTAFQKANNLGVDGIVGKLTWAKLYSVSPAMPVETTVVGRPMVSYGSRGDAVRKLQELLNALGYDCGSVDGIFGSKTKAAVLAFQKANGLAADGIVGPLTWGKLV